MTETLNKFGVPLCDGKRFGIIQPQAAYRFRIIPLTHGIGTTFTSNVEKCDVNMKERTFVIKVRQPILADFLYDMEKIIQNCGEFRLDFMDGSNEGIHSAMQFRRCKMLNCHFSVDYGEGKHIIHTLEYKYDDFLILTPNEEDVKPTPRAEGDLTPEEAIALLEKTKKMTEK